MKHLTLNENKKTLIKGIAIVIEYKGFDQMILMHPFRKVKKDFFQQ